MQIHELPAGTPAAGMTFAGDTGSQTQKIDYDALADAILNKLTTKTFDIKSESKTIIAALNALGDAAEQGVANNLVTTDAGYLLDARQGKALSDLHATNADAIAALNSSTAEIANTVENKTNLGSVYFRTLLNTGTSNRIRIRTTGSGTFMVLSMDRRESGITVAAAIDRYGTTDTCSVLSNGFSGTFTVARDAYGTIVTLPNNNQGLIVLGNLDFSIDVL